MAGTLNSGVYIGVDLCTFRVLSEPWVHSHPSQEGVPGISVNSSPLMTVKAAGSTQLPELLALIALCHTFQGSSPGLIGDRWVLLS